MSARACSSSSSSAAASAHLDQDADEPDNLELHRLDVVLHGATRTVSACSICMRM